MGDRDDYRRAEAWIASLERGEDVPPREGIDTASLVARWPALRNVAVEDVALDGPHGPIPARSYLAPEPEAALVWVHGGGFVAGDLDMPESHWVSLMLAAGGIAVVALDYRKALHGVRHPVPSDDVLAGWREARRRAPALGLPDGPLLLAGASAGANLVAGVTVRLRSGGHHDELPAGLALVYPMLHPWLPAPDPALARALAELPAEAHIPPGFARRLNENLMGPQGDESDPVAYPALAPLADLPPTLIINADADDLRPSGEDFALRARAAGVAVEDGCEAGTLHGYLDRPGEEGALRTLARIVRWAREVTAARIGDSAASGGESA